MNTTRKRQKREPTKFGEILLRAIERRKMNKTSFCSKVGVSTGFISGVYYGDKKPPMQAVEMWARALKLCRDDRKLFVLEAAKTHAPQALLDHVSLLEVKLEKLHQCSDYKKINNIPSWDREGMPRNSSR